MSESAYEIAALTMRYWFAALMVFLLWRIVRAVLRDYAAQRTARKADTGYSLGMLEVVSPETDERGRPHALYGRRFALKRENRIGRARGADIRVTCGRVAPYQASIFQKGNRVMLSDLGGKEGVLLNGKPLSEDTPLIDGDEISVGNVTFVLHLLSAGPAKRRPDSPRGERLQQSMAEGRDGEQPETEDSWSPWARYAAGGDDDGESGELPCEPDGDGWDDDGDAYASAEDGGDGIEETYEDEEDENTYGSAEEDGGAYRRRRRWRR